MPPAANSCSFSCSFDAVPLAHERRGLATPARQRLAGSARASLIALGLAAHALGAGAQTIGDYSRAQRAVIEAEIVRNNAKAIETAKGDSATAAGPAASAPTAFPPRPTTLPNGKPLPPLPDVRPVPGSTAPLPVYEPRMVVSGVFVSPLRTVAEVIVEGLPYLLTAGQEVPGTPYRVQHISPDKVVLVGLANSRSPVAPTRTFMLPMFNEQSLRATGSRAAE